MKIIFTKVYQKELTVEWTKLNFEQTNYNSFTWYDSDLSILMQVMDCH